MKKQKLPYPDLKTRRGFAALFIVIAGVLFFQFAIKNWYQSAGPKLKYIDANLADSFSNEKKMNLFSFDPNVISYDSLVLLGLTKKQSRSIVSYRKAGATYRKPEDLAKLRDFDPILVNMLLPYVTIPAATVRNDEKHEKTDLAILDINTATEAQLTDLPGIGNYGAKAIINYRERIGGFVAMDQLAEVKTLREENKLKALPYLKLKVKLTLLDINHINFIQLKKHPYLSQNQAAAIINYRDKNGLYKRKEDLLKTRLLKQEDIDRLAPYIEIKP